MNRPPASSALIRLALLGLALALSGCKARIGGDTTMGQLVDENADLREQVADLETRLQRRTDELAAVRQQLDGGAHPLPGAQPPTLTSLALGRYSGPLDASGDGVDDTVRVYVNPLDQQGRFLPVAGEALLQVVAIPQDASAEPYVLARRAYDAQQWDAAYRSGFTGTHYTLEAPLPDPLPDDAGAVTLRVDFTQADTGVRVSAQQPATLAR